jgi:hypothetical protein
MVKSYITLISKITEMPCGARNKSDFLTRFTTECSAKNITKNKPYIMVIKSMMTCSHALALIILVVSLSIVGQNAQANSSLLQHGQSLTLGRVTHPDFLFSGLHNPAAANTMVSPNENLRVNYFFSLTNSTEYGKVDDFIDELDQLIDILDDPTLAGTDDVQVTLNRFNRVIALAGDEGYLKTTSGVYFPLFPLFWRPDFLKGTISAELNIESQIRLRTLPAPLFFVQEKNTFDTATSAYIKNAIQQKFSLGYSQALSNLIWGGDLHLGFRLNAYKMELSKQVFLLRLISQDNIEDLIKEEDKNNRRTTTGMGLDIGAYYDKQSYQAGFTITHINSPRFEYGAIGDNCDKMVERSSQQNNCYISDYFSNQLGFFDPNETHDKDIAMTVDGTYHINPRWFVAGSAQLASFDDAVGGENQWLSLSTSYQPKKSFWPSSRFGFHKNIADDKLTLIALGFTFADRINFDLQSSLESVNIEGQKLPRGFGFALSIHEKF